MWLFSDKGFVSIVADQQDPKALLIRGRFKGDIEKLFPDAKVTETPHRDYRFRTSLPRITAAMRIATLMAGIEYHNFKDQIHDHAKHDAYFGVLNTMYDAQERALARRKNNT